MSLNIMDYSLLVGIHSPSSDAARALPPDPATSERRTMSLDQRGPSLDLMRRAVSAGDEIDTAAFNPGTRLAPPPAGDTAGPRPISGA
jgi:hypothetical protein